MGKGIVVVGSINLDLVASTERIPVAGETVIGSNFQTFHGGKGANQAVAAARLGAEVSLIGKVGDDPFGGELKLGLERSGVNTAAVATVKGSSGVALITTDSQGDNSITVVPGANGHIRPDDITANLGLLRNAGMVLAQLEIPLETVAYVAQVCSENGIPFMLDPAPARALPASLLQRVTWLTPNETEASALLGGQGSQAMRPESLAAAGDTLLARGCQNVVLKLGSQGCYFASASGIRRFIPAYKVHAVDTTAAGDAFNAALAVALLAPKDSATAAQWASAVAAISVTRHGAQPSMPTTSEVERFLHGGRPEVTAY